MFIHFWFFTPENLLKTWRHSLGIHRSCLSPLVAAFDFLSYLCTELEDHMDAWACAFRDKGTFKMISTCVYLLSFEFSPSTIQNNGSGLKLPIFRVKLTVLLSTLGLRRDYRKEPAQGLNPLEFRSNQIQSLKLTQVWSVQKWLPRSISFFCWFSRSLVIMCA